MQRCVGIAGRDHIDPHRSELDSQHTAEVSTAPCTADGTDAPAIALSPKNPDVRVMEPVLRMSGDP